MTELLVVLSALIILVLSIAGMNIYRWRTDVLTGPYISNRDSQLTVPEKRTDGVSQATAEKIRTMPPSCEVGIRSRRKREENRPNIFKPGD